MAEETAPRPMLARARRDDPRTSHTAARGTELRGKAATHRAICLKRVIAAPGETGAEIAEATGLERHAASRRLPELKKAGLVKWGPARFCRVQKTMSLTWLPESFPPPAAVEAPQVPPEREII